MEKRNESEIEGQCSSERKKKLREGGRRMIDGRERWKN